MVMFLTKAFSLVAVLAVILILLGFIFFVLNIKTSRKIGKWIMLCAVASFAVSLGGWKFTETLVPSQWKSLDEYTNSKENGFDDRKQYVEAYGGEKIYQTAQRFDIADPKALKNFQRIREKSVSKVAKRNPESLKELTSSDWEAISKGWWDAQDQEEAAKAGYDEAQRWREKFGGDAEYRRAKHKDFVSPNEWTFFNSCHINDVDVWHNLDDENRAAKCEGWFSADQREYAKENGYNSPERWRSAFGGAKLYKKAREHDRADNPKEWKMFVEKYGGRSEFIEAERKGFDNPEIWQKFLRHPLNDADAFLTKNPMERDLASIEKFNENLSSREARFLSDVRRDLPVDIAIGSDNSEEKFTKKQVALKDGRYIQYYQLPSRSIPLIEEWTWVDRVATDCGIISSVSFIEMVTKKAYGPAGRPMDELSVTTTSGDC